MSDASTATYRAKEKKIRMSNKRVYQYMREMHPEVEEPIATPEEVIAFASKDLPPMTAIQGKRFSQPFYRALSEGLQEGLLASEGEVINEETGGENTRYRLLKVSRPPLAKDLTYKQKYEAEVEKLKALRSSYEVCCSTVDKQEAKIAALDGEIADLRAQVADLGEKLSRAQQPKIHDWDRGTVPEHA